MPAGGAAVTNGKGQQARETDVRTLTNELNAETIVMIEATRVSDRP